MPVGQGCLPSCLGVEIKDSDPNKAFKTKLRQFKLSKYPSGCTPENFNFSFPPISVGLLNLVY